MMGSYLRRILLLTFVSAALPVLGVVLAQMLLPVSFVELTRDVSAIGGIHPLMGVLSSLSILGWWTGAAVWLFTATVMPDHRNGGDRKFLLGMGFLTAYLALDDLFMIHDYLVPVHLGLPEFLIYTLLVVAVSSIAWRHRSMIVRMDAVLLLLAIVSLAMSASMDTVIDPLLSDYGDWTYLLEDGLKWAGICFWSGFAVVRCGDVISARPLPKSSYRVHVTAPPRKNR